MEMSLEEKIFGDAKFFEKLKEDLEKKFKSKPISKNLIRKTFSENEYHNLESTKIKIYIRKKDSFNYYIDRKVSDLNYKELLDYVSDEIKESVIPKSDNVHKPLNIILEKVQDTEELIEAYSKLLKLNPIN